MTIHQTSEELAEVANKTHRYFVSYSHSSRYGGSGFGSVHMGLDYPITEIEHVRGIEQWLRDADSDKSVFYVVLNYILLKGPNNA